MGRVRPDGPDDEHKARSTALGHGGRSSSTQTLPAPAGPCPTPTAWPGPRWPTTCGGSTASPVSTRTPSTPCCAESSTTSPASGESVRHRPVLRHRPGLRPSRAGSWASTPPRLLLQHHVPARHRRRRPRRHRLPRRRRPALQWPPRQRPRWHRRWTLLNVPSFHCDPARDGTRSERAVIADLERRIALVLGRADYCGVNKKAMFTIMNWVLPSGGPALDALLGQRRRGRRLRHPLRPLRDGQDHAVGRCRPGADRRRRACLDRLRHRQLRGRPATPS